MSPLKLAFSESKQLFFFILTYVLRGNCLIFIAWLHSKLFFACSYRCTLSRFSNYFLVLPFEVEPIMLAWLHLNSLMWLWSLEALVPFLVIPRWCDSSQPHVSMVKDCKVHKKGLSYIQCRWCCCCLSVFVLSFHV